MGSSTARGNRIYQFSDNDAIEVMASGALAAVADPVTAESTSAAQTAAVVIRGVEQLSVVVDVTVVNAAAANLFIKFRFSDKDSPSVSTPTDWGCVMVDKVDTATGISSVQDYMVKIDLHSVNGTPNADQPRRYVTRIQRVSGIHASALVWITSGAGSAATASVTFVRHH